MPASRGEWPLQDTVKPYHRHFLVCTGGTHWPARIEDGEGLSGRMARDIRDLRENGPDPAPKLTWTDLAPEGGGLDVLVFPERIRYREVGEEAWGAILAEHAVAGRVARSVRREPLPGVHLFVCVNGERDERCGLCGPPLLAALRAAISERRLGGVHAHATSHVGGHKYAGNVLAYPGGVWYGYVGPEDAPRILAEHVEGGRIIEELYRGCMADGPLVST